MDDKRTPVIAGLGGAALAVAMFAGGGHSNVETKQAPHAKIENTLLNEMRSTTNQNGPWYAFCREYTTTGFDKGVDTPDEPGTKGHRVPIEAQDGTVEVTRPYNGETEKFNVKTHVVGDLPSCVPQGSTLRVMIATVPDPNMTQMGLDFDRDIDAIQAAAEANNYAYTRYWFPWRPAGWSPEKSGDPDDEVHRRDEPGILCFRSGARRLFIFLVGETPTSGVNRLQLAHAFYYWQQLRDANTIVAGSESRLAISGPHFSASMPVIEDILAEAFYKSGEFQQTPVLDFVSPDVSGQRYIDSFSAFCNQEVPRLGAPPCIFHTLSLPSNIANWIAANYLNSLGYKSTRIAFLEEGESAFSVGESQQLTRAGPGSNNEPALSFILRFPRDLSSLRSLSDAQSEQIAEAGSKYLSLSQGSLSAPLSARQPTERDTPEPYATEQAAAEAARTLADDVGQMRTARVQAVVVVATNPLDRSYLLEYLHQQLPDVRTATIDADELELNSPQYIDLTGTIAVSVLPPLPNMVAGDNPANHLFFRSSRQQGEYLAVKALLDTNRDPEFDKPFEEKTDPCYAVSVVGQSSFHVLLYGSRKLDSLDRSANLKFPCYESASSGQKVLPSVFNTIDPNSKTPGAFLIFLFVIVIFNVVHLLSLANSFRHVEGFFAYPRSLGPQLEPRRLYLLFALNNQLFLLNLLAFRSAHALWNSPASSHGLWFALLYFPIHLLLLISALLSLVFSVSFFERPDGPSPSDKIQFAIAALYLFTTGFMIRYLPALLVNIPVFLERVTLLGEGLSPLLPISVILAAYFLWGSMQLKRLEWMYCRRIDLGPQLAANSDLYARMNRAMKRAEGDFPEEGLVSALSFALSILGGFVLWVSLKGFDGQGFHWWFVVWGFGGLLLTVILAAYQAWSIWGGLKQLLEWLETTPIREAFKKIGDDGVVKINVWDFTNQRRSFGVLNATAQSIKRTYGSASPEANSVESKLNEFIAADYQKVQVEPGEIEHLSQFMNVGMADAMQALASRHVPGYVPHSIIYLALRLVAFIRYAMLQIMTLVGFVASGYFLAALSVTFYPFAGRKTLAELLALTFIGILALLGLMMTQFGKNAMLSRLEGSTPGEVSYVQVAIHLLTTGGLPLLAVASALFPTLGQFLLSFLRPVLGTLH